MCFNSHSPCANGTIRSKSPCQTVTGARIAEGSKQLENERIRREIAEAEMGRFSELQDENSRLLKNEEELLLLILDMEAQIERLSEPESAD